MGLSALLVGGSGEKDDFSGSLVTASKPVQVLIGMQGQVMGPVPKCPQSNYCIDLRATYDTQAQPDRLWQMPDIHITGNAGLVMASHAGGLATLAWRQGNSRLSEGDTNGALAAFRRHA